MKPDLKKLRDDNPPTQTHPPELVAREVKRVIRCALEKYVWQANTYECRAAIQRELNQYLPEGVQFDVVVSPDNPTHITLDPKNQYTTDMLKFMENDDPSHCSENKELLGHISLDSNYNEKLGWIGQSWHGRVKMMFCGSLLAWAVISLFGIVITASILGIVVVILAELLL